MINEILLRRKNKLTMCDGKSFGEQTRDGELKILTIMKNVEAYGYAFSSDVFDKLMHYTELELDTFYFDLMSKLKPLAGADKVYNPMYPNFPEQVMKADDAELLINAIIHYYSQGNWLPEYEKEARLPLLNDNKITFLSAGNDEDILEILSNLLKSKTSLSNQDKDDVKNIILSCPNFKDYLPDEIPLKENVALLGKIIIENYPENGFEMVSKYFKTATDVLRLITCMSDGDISLATNTKYRNLKRKERKFILNLLANCGSLTEDFFRYKNKWIRIGEIIHPFEYKSSMYLKVNQVFDMIRNSKKPLMFAGKVQNALNSGDIITATNLLCERPGEFARRLDKLIRDTDKKYYVINSFKNVASEVSTQVLLQVRQHFIGRNKKNNRTFFPKGDLARVIVKENNLPDIEQSYCSAIIKICEDALIESYKKKEFMGKVYIDEDLCNYIVPFSQRSASSGNKVLTRGSKVSVGKDAEVVRAFIWWTNVQGERVDIDLSAAIYDENWNYIEHVSYTRLKSDELEVYHSGDITNGGDENGEGVAEFLDANIKKVAKKGRYLVFQIYSYTGQKFSSLPNCSFGWMERNGLNTGEIFEPKTVEMNIRVNSQSTVAIPVVFDCIENRFIWCDMNLGLSQAKVWYGGMNLESNLTRTTAVCQEIVSLNKPDLYSLISLNANARGILVRNRNDADIIFSNDTTTPVEVYEAEDFKTGEVKLYTKEKKNIPIITAFDTDYYMGQLI